MGLLLILRWLPQFIVYCIEMSIWYAVWQVFAGTLVGFDLFRVLGIFEIVVSSAVDR